MGSVMTPMVENFNKKGQITKNLQFSLKFLNDIRKLVKILMNLS